MRIFHPMSRTIACAALALVFATAASAVVAAAQTQGSCPPIIASLFPKNASVIGGRYMSAEGYGSGNGSADLSFSFENPLCVKTEYSYRITVTVTHYGGEMAILIKSAESPYGTIDRDVIQKEFITSATNELARTNITPKRETLGIGEIVYVEYKISCPPVEEGIEIGPLVVPEVNLKGVAWSGNAHLEVKLYGPISVDLARAAVAEVFENLKKADFSKAK